MNKYVFIQIAVTVTAIVSLSFSEEVIGGNDLNASSEDSVITLYDEENAIVNTEPLTLNKEKAEVNTKNKDNGFKSGSIFINAGFLYGSSAIGGEIEFGLARFIGLKVGGGLVGGNFGVHFHVLPKKHIDLFISTDGIFMPALRAVLPDFSFNIRGFFGENARVGVGGKIGIAIITVDRTLASLGQSIRYEAGSPMLTFAVGVTIKAKK